MLRFEFLETDDMLQGPGAALRDALAQVQAIALARGDARAVVAWQGLRADGGAPALACSAGRPSPQPDVVVVSGWVAHSGPHLARLVRRDQALVARLRRLHAAGAQIVAFHNGVALLARAGLMDGRQGVLPWPYLGAIARLAPTLQLALDRRWVADDRVWTVAHPALATEVAFELMEALGLGAVAGRARSVLLPAEDEQRLAPGVLKHPPRSSPLGTLERARRWLEEHLREPFSLPAMARAAAMSERTLLRQFKAHFGLTPVQALHRVRIAQARMLLQATYVPIEEVSRQCGWSDPAMLRRVFKRETGLTPAAWREQFQIRAPRVEWGRDLPRQPEPPH